MYIYELFIKSIDAMIIFCILVMIAAASVGGILLIITACCCVVLIVTCTLHKAKSNPPSQGIYIIWYTLPVIVVAIIEEVFLGFLAMVEHFDMVDNDLYGTKADMRMTRNSAYCHPSHFVHAI